MNIQRTAIFLLEFTACNSCFRVPVLDVVWLNNVPILAFPGLFFVPIICHYHHNPKHSSLLPQIISKICHSLSHGRHFKSFSINVKCPDPCEHRESTRREKQQVERLLLRSTSSAAQAQSNYYLMVHSTARMHF